MKNQDWNTKSDPLFDKFNDITTGRLSTIEARYATTDFLRFDLDRIYELAKPFTNAQQMIDYEGENEKLINTAGRYIQYDKVANIKRPEWFDEVEKRQTKEEVLEEAKELKGKFKDIPENLKQKLWRHYDNSELKILLPNLSWSRKPKSDTERFIILSQYETAAECRNSSKQNKNMLSQVSADKGVKYPKTYALLQQKKSGHSSTRSKRGSYKQRTSSIEQYDLDGNLLQVFPTWDDVINAGFKRSSVGCAIRGTDGHNRHKGYIWKYQ